MALSEPSSDDYAPLTTRERALVAGWEAEVERLREAIRHHRDWIRDEWHEDTPNAADACLWAILNG